VRVFRQDNKKIENSSTGLHLNARKLASTADSNEKLKYLTDINQDFYKAVAKEEINKITKQHSFRGFINQDRSTETGSDIHNKVRRKQDASTIKNSASFKFAL